jgi:tetratricopeptide (TPR) repeat protein
MFRPRRPFRRRRLTQPPQAGAHPRVPPAVAKAERAMRAGRFSEAAGQFDDLAHRAQERAMPEAAAELHLRAARCYMEMDNLDEADDQVEKAIDLFIEARRPVRVRQVLPRALAALERHGRQEDAERLRKKVEEAFGGQELLPGRARAQARAAARLPAKCPSCGGPLRPDEVAWAGPASAECPYCGGVVKAA